MKKFDSNAATVSTNSEETAQATNAAFRDGLFLGQRDAKEGRQHQPTTSRWTAEADRRDFAAGYRLGYAKITAAPGS
jgi:hypothetical protein